MTTYDFRPAICHPPLMNPRNHWAISNASWFPIMNGSTEKVGFHVQAPKSGTLDKFEFMVGNPKSLNASSVIRVSFQDPSTSVEGADGTQDQYRDIAATALTAQTWAVPGLITSDGTDSGTKRTVTKGDDIYCVIEFQTFTSGDQIRIIAAAHWATTNEYLGWHAIGGYPCGADDQGSGWSHLTTSGNASMGPYCVLKYSDGSYEIPVLSTDNVDLVGVLTPYNSSDSPNEKGMKFQVPVAFITDGAWIRGSHASGQTNYDVILYDSGGSIVRSVSFTTQISGAGTEDGLWVQWAPYTMTANSDYTLSVKPTSTTDFVWEYVRYASAAIKTAHLGSTWYYRTRTGTGSWTDYDVYWAQCGLRIIGVEL